MSKFPIAIQTLFCCLVLLQLASAQNGLESSIDQLIRAEMERQKIPGVSLAVVKDGKPMLVKGYGFANLEHQVPVKPETIFQSGSVGKQFTAMAVMLLVEEGKIGLDEKIGKYLGEVPEGWANVTIRHLLTHTGGFTDYPRDFDFRRDYTEDDLLKRAKEVPTAFKPGEKWAYSNLGYVTLGIIVNKVSGKFYGDLLKERVFEPLGMTTARVISEADIVANRAAGYSLQDGQLKNQRWVSPSLNTTADGALYLTVHDMIKWEAALSGGKLLSKASYDQMWAPVKLGNGTTQQYGFGWGFGTVNGNRIIEHGGAWQGFKAHIARFPDKRVAVIVFANLAQANIGAIAHAVAGIVDPALKQAPATPAADTDPAHTAAMKKLFEQVIDGTADMAKFTEQMQAVFKSQTQMSAMLKGFGPIKSFSFIDKVESDQGTRYRYKVEWESQAMILNVNISKEGKIAGYGLRRE